MPSLFKTLLGLPIPAQFIAKFIGPVFFTISEKLSDTNFSSVISILM